LGIVFGYVYYKTGNVIYTILMHMTINFFGGVVAPRLLAGIDLTETDPMVLVSSPAFMGLMVYEAFLYVMAIVGAVFFFTGKKKIYYSQESLQLPKEEEKKVWYNLGMILFTLGCIAMFIYSLVLGYNA
jgi:membrane protease YdiL (CAAX protease family)